MTAARPPVEERKLATILFADLVGSTALGARQDPERTRALLDRFYDAMAAEIERAGGTVEKFAGDAVMAAFGAPAAHEDHGERALHAALALQRRMRDLFTGDLALRIGVNTGEVVVGRAREGSSFVTGDAVNVCARLEQAAQPGEILVGERTVAAVVGAFEFGKPRAIEAKGKQQPVACRPLVRALSLMRPRGVRGLGATFVGRERELEVLEATYHRVAASRRPHLVTIMGDAGVGKTTIARRLWQSLATASPEPLRRTGRCLPYGQGITYWPLAEVLREHLGILESDGREETLARLRGREILGLALGLDVAADLHPIEARARLHDAWLDFLGSLAADAPAVVLIEDLHWAEDDLLELLERTLRDLEASLLMIGTARPDLLARRPAWGGGRRNAALLWLDPLSADETARMLDELLAAELSTTVRQAIVDGAEGNPFFAEELVATMIDRGILERANGGWRARELPPGFEVPDSVQAVLAARIDLLAPTEKAALQAAAVIGRVFWTEPVCELVDGEPDFELLEERDFVRRRPGSSLAGLREYTIKHALTREVAYGTLPKARRARLHAAFAGWMEAAGEGRHDELAPLLAHHYAEAVRAEDADLAWSGEEVELQRLRSRAAFWVRRAGELAVRRYELGDALALLERAVELEPSSERRAALWREIGHAHALRYDGEPFWAAMRRSLELTDDPRARGETYAELALQTSSRAGMWNRHPDRDEVTGWIERALELTEPESTARAKALIAKVFWAEEPRREDAVAAAALADRLGDPDLRALAWVARSGVAYEERRFDEALEWSQRIFDILDELHDPENKAETPYAALIPSCAIVGRFREARRMARAYDQANERLSPHHRLHGIAVQVELEEIAGGWTAIRELVPVLEERVEANVSTPCIRNQRSLLVAAAAAEATGDAAEAARLEQSADALPFEGYERMVLGPRLRLALLRDDLVRAGELLEDAPPRPYVGWFHVSATAATLEALFALGRRDEAEELAEQLLLKGTYVEPFALRALGVVREDDELIRQALERFEAMRLDWHAEQTRTLLA